ncbi:HAMP domain-containing histidine kinase [Nitrosopumilus sp. SJ]|nr:HAMP domain-containing histidine kinase [Nitrosopumilus sp. SJ]
MKIKTNVMLAIWIGIIIPVMLSFILYIVMIKSDIVNDKLEDFSIVSTSVEKILETTEHSTIDQLNNIATRTQMRILLDEYNNGIHDTPPEKIRTILLDALNSNDAYQTISIYDNNGVLVSSTSDVMPATNFQFERPNQFSVIYDQGDIDIRAFAPLYLSGTHIGFIELFTKPLYFETAITDLFADHSSLEIFLASKNNDGSATVITPLKYDNYQSGRIIENNSDRPIIKAFAGNAPSVDTAIDYRGKEVVTYVKYLDHYDLGLVVKIDKADLLATVNVFETWSVIQIIFAGGIIFFPAIMFSRSILKPLKKIQAASKLISQGNFVAPMDVGGVSEIQSLNKSICEMAQQLEKNKKQELMHERLTTIGEMSAKIAHDMRNPISVLKNATKILKLKNIPGTEKYISLFEDSIERMSHQVEDIMGYLRDKPTSYSIFDLNSFMDDASKNISFGKSIQLTIQCPMITITADKYKLQSAIINILHNAKQAIGNNSGWIKINVCEESDEIVMTISNSGPPIPEGYMDKIFEPLFTTKQRGTGLGLRSVVKIVNEHHGTVSVNNDPVTFSIRLPKTIEKEKTIDGLTLTH